MATSKKSTSQKALSRRANLRRSENERKRKDEARDPSPEGQAIADSLAGLIFVGGPGIAKKGADAVRQFGPKGFKAVKKTIPGALKHLKLGALSSVPARVMRVLRKGGPGQAAKRGMEIASQTRVPKRFKPIIKGDK